jgi:hypothetical protein
MLGFVGQNLLLDFFNFIFVYESINYVYLLITCNSMFETSIYSDLSIKVFFLFDMIKPNGYPLGCGSPTGMSAGLVSCPSRFTGTGFMMGEFFAQPTLNLPISICTHM